ncbi:MAG: alpha/beta hydrolase family esterase, partial [Sciscionella sp.]
MTRTIRSRIIGILTLATAAAIATPPAAASAAAHEHPVKTRGCHRAPNLPKGQTVERDIDSGGYHRTYLIHLPAGYDAARPTPVVLAFHGRKGDGSDIEAYSGIDALDAIAVYPRGLPGADDKTAFEGAPYSPPSDDVLFVSDLLDHLQHTLCVDPDRIYATGKSNGGGFTALLACR